MNNDDISVGPNRRVALAAAAFFGFAIGIGVSQAAAKGNIESTLLILIFLGIPFVIFALRVIRRGPILMLESDCLRYVRSGKTISWDKIGELHLIQERWLLGENHILVFTDRSTQERMRLSLDQLSISWSEFVKLVEERIGRRIPVRRQTAIRIRGRAA